MRVLSKKIGLAAWAACLALAPGFAGHESHPHWGYSGSAGPTHWATLEEDFKTCGAGKRQSPIDIRDEKVHKADLPSIQFDYQPSKLRIVDNGHTIQINYAPG